MVVCLGLHATIPTSNPHINNRLACLVRELLELSYLKVVFTVFAAVGVHVIEPFYWKTIDKESTHSSVKDYYAKLYSDLGKVADETFLPWRELCLSQSVPRCLVE